MSWFSDRKKRKAKKKSSSSSSLAPKTVSVRPKARPSSVGSPFTRSASARKKDKKKKSLAPETVSVRPRARPVGSPKDRSASSGKKNKNKSLAPKTVSVRPKARPKPSPFTRSASRDNDDAQKRQKAQKSLDPFTRSASRDKNTPNYRKPGYKIGNSVKKEVARDGSPAAKKAAEELALKRAQALAKKKAQALAKKKADALAKKKTDAKAKKEAEALAKVKAAREAERKAREARRAELNRIGAFASEMVGNLTGLHGRAQGTDWWETADLDALRDEFTDYRGQIAGFHSDVVANPRKHFDPRLDRLQEQLDNVFGRRDTRYGNEEKRISQYEKGLTDFADTIDDQLDGASIRDVGLLTKLDDQIGDRIRKAGRFSSKLDFDLYDELDPLHDYDARVDGLLSEREAELERIKQAKFGYQDQGTSLLDRASDADYYDADHLTDLERSMRDMRTDMGRFSSELDFDFGVDPVLSQVNDRIAALRSERQAALNPYFNRFDQAGTGLDQIDPWDEDTLTDRSDELNDILGDITRFSGGRSDTLRDQIAQSLDLVGDRREQLYDRRDEITGDAEGLLESVQKGSYYGDDDIAARRAKLDEMRGTVDKWGADSATDELDEIDAFLEEQRARLEQDAQNVAQRQQQEQGYANAMLGGAGLGRMMSQRNLSDDQIMSLMTMLGRSSEETNRSAVSAFSRNLGV